MKLVQIVPRLPPSIDGIGDYSIQLAERLRRNHDVHTSFLVTDPDWKGANEINGFKTFCLPARASSDLAVLIMNRFDSLEQEKSWVLLQFAPYGYQSRGCPFWLMHGLLKALKRRSSIRLITMFHELDAERGSPSHSAFWVKDIQKLIIRQLAAASTFRLTNTALHGAKLRSWHLDQVELAPTFSSVGEPTTNLPINQRSRQLVVFGRPWQRRLAYEKGKSALRTVCDLIGAERIIDIGSPIDGDKVIENTGVPVLRCGILPAGEVSRLMSGSIASFLYYPNALLTKSSVYAASSAHGTIPFVSYDMTDTREHTELTPGEDFLLIRGSIPAKGSLDFQDLSTKLYSRYRRRNSTAAASLIVQLIENF